MTKSLVALMLSFVSSAPTIVRETDTFSDSTCGPRCVQWLLDYYEQPDDSLLSLVEEIQGAASQQSTFEMLRGALNDRHVSCRFVDLGPLSILDWPYPAVVHIDGGHFAVAQCLSKTSVSVWIGLSGHQVMPSWQLRARMSTTVLLTSPRSIPDNATCDTNWLRWSGLSLSVCIGLSALCLISRRVRRRY